MIDLLALAAAGALGYLGWRIGTWRMAVPVLTLLAGYLGAFVLYRPLGALLGVILPVPTIVALSLGGLIAWIACSTGFRFAVRWKQMQRMRDGIPAEKPTVVSRSSAVILGATCGAVLVGLGAWALGALLGAAGGDDSIAESASGRLGSKVVGSSVGAAVRQMTGNAALASTAAFVVAKPAQGARAVEEVLSNPGFQAIWRERSVSDAMVRGADDLAEHPLVRRLMSDAAFRDAAGKLGLIGAVEQVDPQTLSNDFAESVGPLVRAVTTLGDDGEIRRLLQEPDFQARYQSGNLAALVGDPTFNRLAERILEAVKTVR